MRIIELLYRIPIALAFVWLITAGVFAGDSNPPGVPGPTMHTLDEIYDAVTAGCPPCPDSNSALVERTGQTASYATGDDGDYQEGVVWPTPRFTDNGDGTVRDNMTGLIWLKDANLFGFSQTWAEALLYCNNLADDGMNLTDGSVAGDWHLPNVKELHSLIDFSKLGPALPSGHPFINVRFDYYWSSSTYRKFPDNSWIVDTWDGYVGEHSKSLSRYVWPVRRSYD